jgi:hypothetical protein
LTRLLTKQVALISVFAALIVVVTRLPGIPIMVGAQFGTIELAVVLYPIAGILLGPYVGALAALLGNSVAFLIPKWSIFGLLAIPAGALSALVAGFLTKRDKWLDWKAAAVVLGVLICMWYIPIPNPQQAYVGLEAPYYPIPLHISALALVLIFRRRITNFINSSAKRLMTLGVGIASYVGIMTDHMFGNLMYANVFFPYFIELKGFRDFLKSLGIQAAMGSGLPSTGLGEYFMVMLPVAIVERLIFTAIAVIIGVAVVRVVGRYLAVWGVSPLKPSTKTPSTTE